MPISLLGLINGYQVTQAIFVVATLGIPDLLAEGARDCEGLAAATGSHPRALYRVLRALAALGVFEEDAQGRFTLTPVGAELQSTTPGSLGAWARLVARPPTWAAWGQLLDAVRTGENAFRGLHGKDVWEFRTTNAEESAIFDLAMRHGSARVATEMLSAYNFARFGHIVDVGGGDGALISAILVSCAKTRGTLFDLPHVVISSPDVLGPAGVSERCEVVSGSFFDGVPPEGDAYLLKHILHDWEDDDATRILRNCRAVMSEKVRLVIVERLLAPPNQGAEGKLSDLNMLVVAGGQERTRDEFEVLLSRAGLMLTAAIPLPSGRFLIEATSSEGSAC